MANELSQRNPFVQIPQRFQADMLVVDEASMMVFPHFLALATLVQSDGNILLAGDNRQLAPIIAHDWENEDRPPAQLYQPFRSAYDAVRRIIVETDAGGDIRDALAEHDNLAAKIAPESGGSAGRQTSHRHPHQRPGRPLR